MVLEDNVKQKIVSGIGFILGFGIYYFIKVFYYNKLSVIEKEKFVSYIILMIIIITILSFIFIPIFYNKIRKRNKLELNKEVEKIISK